MGLNQCCALSVIADQQCFSVLLGMYRQCCLGTRQMGGSLWRFLPKLSCDYEVQSTAPNGYSLRLGFKTVWWRNRSFGNSALAWKCYDWGQ